MPEIESLVGELTLEEKAALCSGISMWETTPIKRLGIPSIFMADGPHGLRKEREDSKGMFKESHPATCFPTAVTLAASWDPELVAEVGRAIAEECLDQGVAMILGPGVNIKRTPLCGRNFEYFSEDPCLAGELAAAFIRGVQEMGVAVSLKHYAANSQEYRRLTISSEVDERALREIYLKAFETAVKKSRPATIMCSYNLVNGIHASENKKLLWDILRKEWDFDGIVISDWGAVNNRVKGLAAGLDLEMPSSNGIHDQMIVEAVKAGKLDPEVLDRAVARILRFVFKCAETREKAGTFQADYEKHHQLARRAAASGAVLLKNEKRLLPLSPEADFAVIGRLARKPRYQGSGSSRVNPRKLVSFCDCLEAQGIPYAYAPGYTLAGDGYSEKEIAAAVELARKKEYVLVFAGLTDEYESESFDRRHMEMPRGHNELISALAGVSENVIVVLSCGSPVEMPWLDRVGAVLNLYLGGEAAGEAAYDLLFGRVNPSGKLAETFPRRLEDCLGAKYFGMGPRQVHYRESIFVGYRYYDSAQKEVLFPFGHGLSYTRFDYANLELSAKSIDEKGTLTVSFDITNSGDRDGAETAQLYVRDCAATHFVPEKELRAFKKVFLKSGETKRVTLELGREAFAFYNVRTGSWCVETGDFEILVGASSRDIRLRATVRVNAPAVDIEDYREKAPVYYKLAGVEEIPQEQFEALLGRKLPPDLPLRKGELGLNSTIGDLGVSLFGRIFKWAVGKFAPLALARKAAEFEKKMVREGAMSMPLRNLYSMSDGAVPYEAVLGLLEACKGKTVRGLCRFARAMFSRKPPRKADIYR
ncbi:MAG: glycosyl hydrolase [Firmicutes bacterium]|nr:glycosyl hydrolase [Bacillota bacterium]HPU00924.1 glycoside hydrolase family 3 C-terminal domain-containing protein [Bacillota bacterium]